MMRAKGSWDEGPQAARGKRSRAKGPEAEGPESEGLESKSKGLEA